VKYFINKAKTSKFFLSTLNLASRYKLPFNRPHKIKISKITDDTVEARLPYRKSNLNHLNGIHAAALFAVSEFTSGVLLMSKFDPSSYRLIMEGVDVKYHYQARKDVTARCTIQNDNLKKELLDPLEKDGLTMFALEVKTYDVDEHHISTAMVRWQIKDWSLVKTKV
jgi:acyl-coenzyme A thioesterase PaaI-like protein